MVQVQHCCIKKLYISILRGSLGGKRSKALKSRCTQRDSIYIVTTTEIFKKVLAAGVDPNGAKIREIMTAAPLITIGFNATVKEAADLMIKHNIRRPPVVEDGTLVGIITSKHLLKSVK